MNRSQRRTVRLVTLVAISVLSFACGTGAVEPTEPAYAVVDTATIQPGDAVPAPAGEEVLRLSGAISTANDGHDLVFDMATLERLGTVEYRIEDDQALGRRAMFTGVLLADLLAVAGVEGAEHLQTRASNDYEVTIPATDPAELPVLIATSVDGERMDVEAYGPLRIVYPEAIHDLDPTVYNPRFIWQLVAIDVI